MKKMKTRQATVKNLPTGSSCTANLHAIVPSESSAGLRNHNRSKRSSAGSKPITDKTTHTFEQPRPQLVAVEHFG
jgi:hypothetical protein